MMSIKHHSTRQLSWPVYWGILITFIALMAWAISSHGQTNTPASSQVVVVQGSTPQAVAEALDQFTAIGFAGWITRLVARWPKIAGVLLAIGALRPLLHSFNAYLTNYCKRNLSDAQFASLVHLTGSANWKRLEFIVHLLFSIQPSILLGSVQIKAAGDSDQQIHIPMRPLPENQPKTILIEKNPTTGETIQH